MAHHEAERAEVQHALDRGTLVAASLRTSATKQEDIDDIIQHFLDTRTVRTADVEVTTRLNEVTNAARDISAVARGDISTSFVSMMGVRKLAVAAGSRAIERDPNIEMSIVLDYSGSMGRPESKINSLKTAAQRFIDEVVGTNPKDKVSVNLVPYNWHVNVGEWMFDRLAATSHTLDSDPPPPLDVYDPAFGHCYRIDFEDDLVQPLDIARLEAADTEEAREIILDSLGTIPNYPSSGSRQQITTAEFVFEDGRVLGGSSYNACSTNTRPITYLEGDKEALKTAIRALEAGGSTATYYAMQWALGLLHPDSRPLLSGVPGVRPAFAARPAPWDDRNTDKFMIVFSDGQLNVQGDFYTPFGESIPTQGEAEAAFTAQCDYANARGITVFTIAFEMSDVPDAEQLLRDCASTTEMYYEADSGTIGDVFDSIARNIQALKLTN
jgi:Mg-chelatase subunit ChlD